MRTRIQTTAEAIEWPEDDNDLQPGAKIRVSERPKPSVMQRWTQPRLAKAMLKYAIRVFRAETQPIVGELAAELSISERTLNRLTHEHFGCSPGRGLARIRREYARRLAARRPMTNEQLATRAGYGTSRSFYRDRRRRDPGPDGPLFTD